MTGLRSDQHDINQDGPVVGADVGACLVVEDAQVAAGERIVDRDAWDTEPDPICRRLMTVPGVGPVTALTFRATVDVRARFARSHWVGADFGLTPRKWQSGEIDRMGRISKCGDAMMRTVLYEAANVMLTRTTQWLRLRARAMQLAKRRG